MTVKDLIERLSREDQDALVYTMAHDDDIAIIVTYVMRDVLVGTGKPIVMVY